MRSYRPVPIQEFVNAELDQRFTPLLREVDPLVRDEVLICRKRFSTWSDGVHTFHRVMLCRRRNACPIDARVEAYGLADDAISVIHSIFSKVGSKVKFLDLDFTLPRDVQSRVKDDELPLLRRIAWSVIIEILASDGLKLGGVGVAQFWHTKDPLSGWYPHCHFTVFNMAFRGDQRVEFPVYVTPEKLEAIKSLWRERVEQRWGVSKSRQWVLFARYSQGYGHLRHRLAYAFRYPVTDLYKAIQGGGYVSRPSEGWVRRMLNRPRKEKRIQWFGWMAQSRIYSYAERLEVSLPRKKEREAERRRVFCPLCGRELERVFEGVSLEHIPAGSLLLVFRQEGIPSE